LGIKFIAYCCGHKLVLVVQTGVARQSKTREMRDQRRRKWAK
jgi:hypothetical protein